MNQFQKKNLPNDYPGRQIFIFNSVHITYFVLILSKGLLYIISLRFSVFVIQKTTEVKLITMKQFVTVDKTLSCARVARER